MNIILVIPPSPNHKKINRMIDCSHETKANYLWQPNDFLIITSLLKKEDTAVLIDGTADSLPDNAFNNAIEKAAGDIIVFALSSVCWESDYRFFRDVRGLKPGIPVFVIGDIFFEPEYRSLILQEADGIVFNPYALDLEGMAGIRSGEKELPGCCTIPERSPFPQGKRIASIATGVPRHEIFQKRGYRFPFARHFRFATLTTMWGCPFSCSYCTDSQVPPMVRNADDVIAELEHIKSLGIKELFIADKTFGFVKENSFRILGEMKSRFDFSWSCYFHPQTYDPVLLEDMAAAGCHTIIAGVDSSDIESLRQYGRFVDRKRLEALFEHANDLNISICADFILGLSHETEADIIRTIDYALDLPIDFASFNIAAPLPGSHIRRQLVSSGRWALGKEGFDTSGRLGVFGNAQISEERLRALRKKAFLKFYVRPAYLLRRLKRTASFEHLLIQLSEMFSMLRKV